MEEEKDQPPKLNRSSMLVSLAPGSVLSKRIAYSRESVRAPPATVKLPPAYKVKIVAPTLNTDKLPENAKNYELPRLVNPDSSLAKRYAYSEKKKGKTDPLSGEMRSYFNNTSMIDTWLMHRVMKEMKANPVQSASTTETSTLPENSYFTDQSSSLSRRHAYSSSRPKNERDALLPETRQYFLYKSQLQTWGEERVVRAIYSWINRKYGGPSELTALLKPTRRFITSILQFMPPDQRSLERLLRLVEEQWIKPRYVHYQQSLITESLGLSDCSTRKNKKRLKN